MILVLGRVAGYYEEIHKAEELEETKDTITTLDVKIESPHTTRVDTHLMCGEPVVVVLLGLTVCHHIIQSSGL